MKPTRQEQIYQYIKEHENAGTLELAAYFNVSDMTVRRDLTELESQGRIARFHGGAFIPSEKATEHAFSLRAETNKSSKLAIGRRAGAFLQERQGTGEPVFLGSGSTVYHFARQLSSLGVPLITDSLHTALTLAESNSVIMLGGEIAHPSLNATGYLAEKMLSGLAIGCAFIGSSAIDESGCICAYNMVESGMCSTVISNSKHIVILADHTKIGKSNMVKIHTLDSKFTLITDAEVPCLDQYRELGAEVIVTACGS